MSWGDLCQARCLSEVEFLHAAHRNRSLKELLDDAVKRDLGKEMLHEAGNEQDSAMIDKLRRDVLADCYGIDLTPAVQGEME